MEASLVRHKKTRNSTGEIFLDNFAHEILVQVKSNDATFHLLYLGSKDPESIVQTSGFVRSIKSQELSVAYSFYSSFLKSAISESLLECDITVNIAQIVTALTGRDSFFGSVVVAYKLKITKSAEARRELLFKEIQVKAPAYATERAVDMILHEINQYESQYDLN